MTTSSALQQVDPEVAALIDNENARQRDSLRLIASENYVSHAVLEATGSVLTNKYSEGYADKRYYQGQAHIDAIEQLACSRLRELYGAAHVNVQPYSGSPANLAVTSPLPNPVIRSWGWLAGRRAPDSWMEGEHQRQVLQQRRLRRQPRGSPHRHEPGARARP